MWISHRKEIQSESIRFDEGLALETSAFESLRWLIACGRTRRVNWVCFSETWLKILNNLTRLKVGYNKITGLHFMSGRTEMGFEVG